MKKIRVLVVDDSALMRKMIPHLLDRDPGIEVVGTAMDGLFAVKKIRDLRPDVITLDVNMPRMDGIETLRYIVRNFGVPTVIVSSLTMADAELTFSALEIGAFDFVTKPQGAISLHINEIGGELIGKVRAAFENRRIKAGNGEIVPSAASIGAAITRSDKKRPFAGKLSDRVLAIGISTGGPNALSHMLTRLPKDFPAAILIVQHMPAGFTGMFAARLNAACAIEVKEAGDGDLILEGRALIAPGDRHLKVRRNPLGAIAVLSSAPPVKGHRPSADVLFRSVASEYGDAATGLIMTGMGDDGSEGIGEIMAAGGLTIAQDEDSCVVFGMPRAAVEKGHIGRVISLEDMADHLISYFTGKESAYGAIMR